MENWIILNKLIILIYVSIKIVNGSFKYPLNIMGVILFLLIFIVLNIGKAIIQKNRYKQILICLSVLELLLCYFFVNHIFIFLIPINVLELFSYNKHEKYSLVVLVLTVFFVDVSILSEYIVISSLNFIGFIFILNGQIRIQSLLLDNEKLQGRNAKLVTDLNNQVIYKHQIIYTSQLEERNKIAQEIHDKLGHSISGSLMQLEAAKLVMDMDKEKSKHMIQNIINVLRDGMESIRGTLKNIKPEQEQLGINKIKLLVDEFKNNGEISVALFYSDNLDSINFLHWKIIYENIKEALTNILKYSKAKNVKVDIKVLNKMIKVEVKDDGQGSSNIIKGLGLSGIEERTMNLNGKLIIDGSKGFSVIALLPIESQ